MRVTCSAVPFRCLPMLSLKKKSNGARRAMLRTQCLARFAISIARQPRIEAYQRRGMSLQYGNRRLRRQSCGDPLA